MCGRTDGRTDGRTNRHSSNVLEFCADQMSPRNIGSQIIIISRCYKRIDKTNIPSLRRDRIECNQPREVISYGGPAQVDEKRRCFLVPRHRNGESCMLLVRAVSLEDFKTKQKNKLRWNSRSSPTIIPIAILIKVARSKIHSTFTLANFGNKNKVHFWNPHEILYEIDTQIEYPKFTFQLHVIRKTSVIFVNWSKINVSDF